MCIRDSRWLSYIRAAAKARFSPEDTMDISDCGEKVKQIISDNLKSLGVIDFIKPISIIDKDFQAKIKKLGSDRARASSMEPVSYTHLRAHETVLDLVCR